MLTLRKHAHSCVSSCSHCLPYSLLTTVVRSSFPHRFVSHSPISAFVPYRFLSQKSKPNQLQPKPKKKFREVADDSEGAIPISTSPPPSAASAPSMSNTDHTQRSEEINVVTDRDSAQESDGQPSPAAVATDGSDIRLSEEGDDESSTSGSAPSPPSSSSSSSPSSSSSLPAAPSGHGRASRIPPTVMCFPILPHLGLPLVPQSILLLRDNRHLFQKEHLEMLFKAIGRNPHTLVGVFMLRRGPKEEVPDIEPNIDPLSPSSTANLPPIRYTDKIFNVGVVCQFFGNVYGLGPALMCVSRVSITSLVEPTSLSAYTHPIVGDNLSKAVFVNIKEHRELPIPLNPFIVLTNVGPPDEKAESVADDKESSSSDVTPVTSISSIQSPHSSAVLPLAERDINSFVREIVGFTRQMESLDPTYTRRLNQARTRMPMVDGFHTVSEYVDFISQMLDDLSGLDCQSITSAIDVRSRMKILIKLLKKQIAALLVQKRLKGQFESRFKDELSEESILKNKKKRIETELGEGKGSKDAITSKFMERLEKKVVPSDVKKVIDEEMNKLMSLEPESTEFNITRNYLDWLTIMPYGVYTEDNFDIDKAERILDEDHYGLADIKSRILEFIATAKLAGKSNSAKILCFVGPPGVGKTSVGKSIARALNRAFYRFSVGGLDDTAEIKGHRRTYIGSLPGKLIHALKKTQSANPVILIDEIDKLGKSYRGDPAAALLEVLDPEQNKSFVDHYLDVQIDLSQILFICTGNVQSSIPGPLADRMDFIPIAGYVWSEKLHITQKYLEPVERANAGVLPEQCKLTDAAVLKLVKDYCREAGVRSLKKYLERIYRKVALKLARAAGEDNVTDEGKADTKEETESTQIEAEGVTATKGTSADASNAQTSPGVQTPIASESSTPCPSPPSTTPRHVFHDITFPIIFDEPDLVEYCGHPKFSTETLYESTKSLPVGVAHALAWNEAGGSSLFIECSVADDLSLRKGQKRPKPQMENDGEGEGSNEKEQDVEPSRGSLITTGSLGDVMRESVQIAYTVSKRFLSQIQPHNKFFSKSRIHLHVPAGATPKDGPSAGITIVCALLSLATNTSISPVRSEVSTYTHVRLAMTGELTLTGRVLPIGGVKEKLLAAKRSLVTDVILPEDNRKDYLELPGFIREGISVHFAGEYQQVFQLAFPELADNAEREGVMKRMEPKFKTETVVNIEKKPEGVRNDEKNPVDTISNPTQMAAFVRHF